MNFEFCMYASINLHWASLTSANHISCFTQYGQYMAISTVYSESGPYILKQPFYVPYKRPIGLDTLLDNNDNSSKYTVMYDKQVH